MRQLRVAVVLGWSAPNACSRMANARAYQALASKLLPCTSRRHARSCSVSAVAGMLSSLPLFANTQCLLEERLSFLILALIAVEFRQASERMGHMGMLQPHLLRLGTQRTLIQLFSMLVPDLF